jgi:hypothetical protein
MPLIPHPSSSREALRKSAVEQRLKHLSFFVDQGEDVRVQQEHHTSSVIGRPRWR